MTFFYNLNKKLAELAGKQQAEQLSESAVAERATGDYSAKKARAGKDIGQPGKNFEKIAKGAAERYGSKERGEKVAGAVLAKLRAKEGVEEQYILEKDVEEGNEFSGALARAKAAGAKEFEVDGKKYQVKEAAKPDYIDLDKDGNRKESMKKAAADKKKHAINEYDFDDKDDFDNRAKRGDTVKTSKGTLTKTDTGVRHEKRHEEEPEMDDRDDDAPKKKGRKAVGAGKGKKIGAKHAGTSKLHRKAAIAETDEEMIALVDKGEYDREGDMAKEQLHTIESAAEELASILSDDENLPEWVQSKITKALDYIDTARDYMKSSKADNDQEMMPERKLSSSEKEEREDIVKGMKKNKSEFKKRYGDKGEAVMYATATKLAKERGPGNPDRKKEESVAETDAPKKSKGGIQFGKGVYESMNSRVENMISEGMNISVNMSTDANGQPTKNITVSAEGDDAEALAQLLNLAGMNRRNHQEELEENKPDWPTDQETIDNDDPNLEKFAGGLNGPKSTGQTTGAPINRQLARQGAGKMAESTDIGMSLYKELQQFKGK
ncbi:hypothetical protein UFOVP328_281 [uncultured Caudovirales phage]|uniref:Uncharacterized protein n=1 Tax=uncultured Caudovirales phage TaxID=2100421 RepID=A0A6J5LUI0_9CAUD|nr:hypothetical protein UFOVP328_281 [uncultured Caudovirales phage]